jgi:aryl-alcohol dehydrogenase-like predicted oxidoreductase
MTYGASERGNHTWMMDETISRPLIRNAPEPGIDFPDAANVYPDGTSEEIVVRLQNRKHPPGAAELEISVLLGRSG